MFTPSARKTSCASGVGQVEHVGPLGDDGLRDLDDVLAAVAVLGGGLAAGARQQRPGEPVDLRAVVVEVVLPGDLGAGALEDPAQGVADRGPPGAAEVDRAGRVGGDELQVDLLRRRTGRCRRTTPRPGPPAGRRPPARRPRRGCSGTRDRRSRRTPPRRRPPAARRPAAPGHAAGGRPSWRAAARRWSRSRRGRGSSGARPPPSRARRRAASRCPRRRGHRGRGRGWRRAGRVSPLKGIGGPRGQLGDHGHQLGRLERLGEVGVHRRAPRRGPGRRPAPVR